MTAFTSPRAALSAEVVALSPVALVSGPCALPVAPLAMPAQVIEPAQGLLRRLIAGITPSHPAAPSAGTGH